MSDTLPRHKATLNHIPDKPNRILSSDHLRSVCFARKPSVKIVFHIFQCLVVQKKPGQWKTIFGQQKTLIKIRLIFYRLFSKKKIWKTISLSRVASPINIIFVYSHGKHNFLAPSLSLMVSFLTFSLFPLLFLSSHPHYH